MEHQLSIDIETYSSVDITKSGLFKYVQSPDFQILLFAYSVDGQVVQLIDLTDCQHEEFYKASCQALLLDPNYIKHAYNAPFEWYCLSKWLGLNDEQRNAWLSQWRCTMLHGLYCGYPAGLAAVGKALGLPQDKQKDGIGKALIKYFCSPCAPTKANGGRTRNLPQHDPEKWHLFGEYCRQDVVTEMAVDNRLFNYPVPDRVQNEWEVDQRINARGVAADLQLMEGALWCGETVKTQLMAEARQISGLDNPNSLQQLTEWLEKETDTEITNLRKDTVKDLLGGEIESDAAHRMLEIRQLLGKTSTKKYNASGIFQSVEDKNAAWHCGDGGSGAFKGRCTNANSIGIEVRPYKVNPKSLLASDKDWYFHEATIANLTELVRSLMAIHGIDADHVIRHCDVTAKACPRPWEGDDINSYYGKTGNQLWAEFKEGLKVENMEAWKTEIGEKALADGIITDKAWLGKLDDPAPVWMVLALANKLKEEKS